MIIADLSSDIMKLNTSLLLLFLLGSAISKAQVMIIFNNNNATTYSIKGGDEFESSAIDREKWMTAFPWARHLYCSMDVSVYSDGDDLVLKDGQLHITARKAPVTTRAIPYESDDFNLTCDHKPSVKNLMKFDYQSGLVYSKQQFTYGYYEINFRADAGNGLWPAFWLFGEENQEIDIFEIGGLKTHAYHVDIHCKNGCDNYKRFLGVFRSNWGDYLETDADWSTSFHTLAINWTTEGITWFIDGTPVAWWEGKLTNPMSVIANVAVTDKEGSFGGKINERTKFPSEMTVNYIRVWQPDSKASLQPVAEQNSSLSTPVIPGQSALKHKTRPEYRNKVIKNYPDRIFAAFNKSNQLEILLQSVQKSTFIMTIKNTTGNTILERRINAGMNLIELGTLTTGNYEIIFKNDKSQSSIRLEMP